MSDLVSAMELVLFENTFNVGITNKLILTDKKLVRYEPTRIVIYEDEQLPAGDFVYDIASIEKEAIVEDVVFAENGALHVSTQNNLLKIEASKDKSIILEIQKLLYRLEGSPSTSFEVNSKEFSRKLMAMSHKIPDAYGTVYINLEGVMGCLGTNLQEDIEVHVHENKLGIEDIPFSYNLAKSLFINSSYYTDSLLFELKEETYSVVSFGKKIKVLLTHKKS